MSKTYRLLAKAQIDGEVRDPGYVFTLKDGVEPPKRAVHSMHSGGGAMRDELLCEEIQPKVHAAPAPGPRPGFTPRPNMSVQPRSDAGFQPAPRPQPAPVPSAAPLKASER